jgi:hypothetical protein
MNLDEIFNLKLTENGDISFSKVSDNILLNILFLTEYYSKHRGEVPQLEANDLNRLFSMFIRDPRYGLGRRDLGRKLMSDTHCSIEQIVKAGRVDDLFYCNIPMLEELDWCKEQILAGNELVKKWMPRYSSKNLQIARIIAKTWGMNKQQYGHFIKCNTTENKLSRHNYDEIEFEHVPSLAMIKYAHAFAIKPETSERYKQYLEDVKAGKKDLKVSTTTVYDIYKNRNLIDADLFFSKIEKISGNWIPIVDTSGSMVDNNDSFGKALAIGHYLAKCSSYAPNKVISFSSYPQLITLGNPVEDRRRRWYGAENESVSNSQYQKEIDSMYTGDCSNTDFGAVMNLLSLLDDVPQYLIVLSDMEFDCGSRSSKEATMQLFKSKGYKTRIVWWNLNSRNITCPEMDKDGNIFLSGYNPMLLKFLEAGFNGEQFLYKLLREYAKAIQE